jgi:hypothetical protein
MSFRNTLFSDPGRVGGEGLMTLMTDGIGFEDVQSSPAHTCLMFDPVPPAHLKGVIDELQYF